LFYHAVKKADDMLSRFDTRPNCDKQTDRRTDRDRHLVTAYTSFA